jgi:DNA-binding CsgD family transcriptional regulator
MEGQGPFTPREKQMIALLLEGKSNKQMALALGTSVRTVEFHLSKIYSKLGVSSRTEAALKLSQEQLRESAMEGLRNSTVAESEESGDNAGASISHWRLPMKTIALILTGLLALTLVIFLVLFDRPSMIANAPIVPTFPATAVSPTPSGTSTPEATAKEHILEQIRQLVAGYDQAVQAEKKNGMVEFSKDPLTGQDIFLFKDDSYVRMMLLNEQLWQKINQLDTLYVQIYRDETQPTPFPTAASTQEFETSYEQLLTASDAACVPVGRLQNNKEPTIFVYDVDDGKYHAIGIGDEYAHCEVYGQIVEEWRTAPLLARVNKDADTALIRRILDQPDLVLKFQSIGDNGNDGGRNDAIYADDIGTKYYVDIEAGRLASIQSGFAGHPNAPANAVKSVDELRRLARQFATANSPRFSELEAVLSYQEGSKGDGTEAIYFFNWRYTSRDWTGTDWAMMPPFLQIGMLGDGQIVTYFDTLDLFE